MITYPTIPENIVVHIGAPDSDGQNITENFVDYIKNVASSEIYPTWPEEAIRANVLAQISVALNRVYTEYYRSRGYNFDITSTPAYDQTYVYQRNIFDSVSRIVDETFNSYIRRENFIEPLFAAFCDGVEVSCDGLSQWGSVELAKSGLNAEQILKSYYGDNIEIVRNVPIENIPESAPPVPLREGDTGAEIELLQTKLNRISKNFPGIPKIYPVDGFFDRSTTDAVRKFQEIFNLTVDGIIGRNTWYEIQLIYNAVKKLSTVNSEGLRIENLATQYSSELSVGDVSPGVLALQYYLQYIALFVPSVTAPITDGIFGEGTRNAVISFQKTFGLPQNGVVDRLVWTQIQNTYYDYLESVPYKFSEGVTLPFPGRVLRVGIEGEDVRALQEYLNYIARSYPEIAINTVDGVFGPTTAAAVRAFKQIFGLPNDPERVSVDTWKKITEVYDDLYSGNSVQEGQYPGYEIS